MVDSITSSQSTPSVCLGSENSNRLVSLLDIMKLFSVEDCGAIFSFFGEVEKEEELLGSPISRELPPYRRLEVLKVVLLVEEFCRNNLLVESNECATRLLAEK